MKVYAITDTGIVRKENQDAFAFELLDKKNRAVIVVCDGMGGARAGSVASRLAVDTFLEEIRPVLESAKRIPSIKDALSSAVTKANAAVHGRSLSAPEYHGMGTTLVAVFKDGSRYAVANIGDSRAYHISGDKVSQITRDHSFVEELVSRGELTREQARVHPRKNIITRALGIDPEVRCDFFELSLKKGDYILLCSDGLSNLLLEDELAPVFIEKKEPEAVCTALLALALERGAPDNVTVVALSV